MVAEKMFGTGAIRDTKDERDFQWSELGHGSAPFDWSKGYDVEAEISKKIGSPFTLPIKDQGTSGSCGGQAWSYLDASIEALATGTYEERSARFVYSQTFVPGGGSAGRTNAEILKNQGDARELMFTSYIGGAAPDEVFMEKHSDITAEVKADAKSGLSLSYGNNIPLSINELAKAVRDNGGIILGIVGQDNGTWLTAFPKPPADSGEHWYHWIYVGKARLIGGKKYLGFANSWGEGVGQSGWQWLSEEYVNTILPHDPDGRAIWSTWFHTFSSETPPAGFHHTFNQDLQYQMVDAEVVNLQTALKADEVMAVSIPFSPRFGEATLAAVKKFQLKHSVVPATDPGYGRCGPKTRAALNKIFG
jgi:hypothetical protein